MRHIRAGESFTQKDFLTYIYINHLSPGEDLTLRGSAPGYEPQEQTVVPILGVQIQVDLRPARIQ